MADLPDDVVQALDEAGVVADAAVKMLDRYPEVYRVPILVSLLKAVTAHWPAMRTPSVASDSGGHVDVVVPAQIEYEPDALGVAAVAAGVPQVDLERIIHVGDDGFLRLLLRVDGSSMAERANRATAIYCFIKEHGFGEKEVGIDELRRLCIEQQAYNAPNFARNLQNRRWLLVIGEPRSKKKQYRLSPQGEEAAIAALRELLGV